MPYSCYLFLLVIFQLLRDHKILAYFIQKLMDTQSFKNALFQIYNNKYNIFISNKPKLQLHIHTTSNNFIFSRKKHSSNFLLFIHVFDKKSTDLHQGYILTSKSLSLVEWSLKIYNIVDCYYWRDFKTPRNDKEKKLVAFKLM